MSQQLEIITTCEGCGACCLEQESPPGYIYALLAPDQFEADDPDLLRVQALPAELRAELEQYIADRRAGQPHPRDGICLWYDEATKRCRHYELRPEICREAIQPGDEGCLAWRQHYRIGYRTETIRASRITTAPRNAACPCGSGRKFKHCCHRPEAATR